MRVRGLWGRVRGFWQDEEIPRWMGMSLVLLYVMGVTAAAWVAVSEVQDKHRTAAEQQLTGAVTLLGDRLSTADPEDLAAYQRVLRQFSRDFSCAHLRVVDAEQGVVASIRADEVGGPNPFNPQVGTRFPGTVEVHALPADLVSGADAAAGKHYRLFRLPLHNPPPRVDGPQRVIEGVLHLSTPVGIGVTSHAATFVVILSVTVALLLLYRGMRRHYRVYYHIRGTAGEASTDVTRLADELDALRVADTKGAVAQTWNGLIDLVEELRAETQRASASDELRRALEQSTGGQLADALNTLPDALLHISDGETIQYANSMAVRLLGWKRDESETPQIASLRQLETGPLGGRLVEMIGTARRPGGDYEALNEVIEAPASSTPGAPADHYRVRVLPLRRSARGASSECMVVVSDVSQQVRADLAREEFVSQVTHELRTPLTNIRAYAETLSSGMFDDPQVITECYNVITKETRRLSRLIEDILSISQMEAGSMQLVEDDVDVRTLLSEAVRDVRGLADEKNIDLQMELPSKLGNVQGDRDKLAVVMNNLLGNALKYTPSGGSVRLGCSVTDSELKVTVKDSGIGIDPADHDRIFEKFQRSNDPDVQNETGTGIGLTTAREIARRHGGDIELMSQKGEGSTFVVTIPMASSDRQVALAGAGSKE